MTDFAAKYGFALQDSSSSESDDEDIGGVLVAEKTKQGV